MALECGIVGLPNVGKSTLFNALTASRVPAENFPFCTVDPHRGVVVVPDERLEKLYEMVQPVKKVPTCLTFVDIAGLVKGASQGEGLGNQFLSHIREVEAIAHVVRCFEDSQVTHVMGAVDPLRDMEVIDLELCLSDLEMARRQFEKIEKVAKAGQKEAKEEVQILEWCMNELSRGVPLRRCPHLLQKISQFSFLTAKPVLYVANISELDVKQLSASTQKWLCAIENLAQKEGSKVIPLCISLEQQVGGLDLSEKISFYAAYGMKEPGLHPFIREVYALLSLITYFTAGPKEVRAWTIEAGTLAPEAAGVIHSDFQKGFIRAEVIAFEDYVKHGGEKGARQVGLMRSEGKDYQVKDGDVMLFRFNV